MPGLHGISPAVPRWLLGGYRAFGVGVVLALVLLALGSDLFAIVSAVAE